jgi:hypothetical protein
MQSNGQVSTTWLINRAIKGLNATKAIKTANEAEKNTLIKEIQAAITELENIRKYFEFANEPELIEYAIYTEKAALTRLSYLLKQAKKDEKCNKFIETNPKSS